MDLSHFELLGGFYHFVVPFNDLGEKVMGLSSKFFRRLHTVVQVGQYALTVNLLHIIKGPVHCQDPAPENFRIIQCYGDDGFQLGQSVIQAI